LQPLASIILFLNVSSSCVTSLATLCSLGMGVWPSTNHAKTSQGARGTRCSRRPEIAFEGLRVKNMTISAFFVDRGCARVVVLTVTWS
jgi:hypothetical protein